MNSRHNAIVILSNFYIDKRDSLCYIAISDYKSRFRRDVILTEVTITKGLAYMRKRANLKQFELADILKVERSTIAKWESGAAFPRAAQLPELAAALHCTIDELYQPPEESA